MLVVAALLLGGAIFLPIWKIELYAPQYPEGLVLLIYADKLAGNVDIINGLNHYIGMATLHTENFIEFSIMRYIFGFFVVAILLAAFIRSKKMVYAVFTSLVLFSILAMGDFYRWNYNYGHHLDPNAAIKVPGMTYQPPLIGFKQLLNFGAYSIPDIGGLLLVASGLILLFVILLERKVFSKLFKRKSPMMATAVAASLILLASCTDPGPKRIKLNVDSCAFCKMTITNAKYATQFTTHKGRHYVFDDIICMADFVKENSSIDYGHFYVADFCKPEEFTDVSRAILLQDDDFRSPMRGNTAGFAVQDSASHYKTLLGANEVKWDNLIRK